MILGCVWHGFVMHLAWFGNGFGRRFFDAHVGAIDFAETVVKKSVAFEILDLGLRFPMSIWNPQHRLVGAGLMPV